MRQALMNAVIAVALLLVASNAWADCSYNGGVYPTGTKLGPLTCMPDGSWR